MLPQEVEDHYRRQQRLAATAVVGARTAWDHMDPRDFDRTWRLTSRRLTTLVMAAQLRAATDGAAYIPAALSGLDADVDPLGEVNPAAFSGVASSGVPLEDVLYVPVIRAKQAVTDGLSGHDALQQARSVLDGIVATQIADAGRAAAGVAVTARPGIGYVRMLNPPSCARCAILAGKFFRWNAGFSRHPRCDCRHIPSTENLAGDLTTNTRAYFDSLKSEAQNHTFTKAGAQAIREGADINQVVNARRGMTAAGRTTEGITRHGVAGRRLRAAGAGRIRLMPEEIYRQAATRTDAIAALRAHGYLG